MFMHSYTCNLRCPLMLTIRKLSIS